MNILRALFGAKSTPVFSTPKSRGDTYLAEMLRAVSACDSPSQLAVFACDYSGYVREAALVRCVKLSLPELLPVVCNRLNDWVPEVRNMARSALMTLIPFTPAGQLLATLPTILRLLLAARTDHKEWVEQFETNLIRMVGVKEITAAVSGADVRVARACFDILMKYQLPDTDALFRVVLGGSEDIVLAVRAVQMCAGLPSETRRAHYLTAAKSKFGAVRTIAVRALLTQQGDAGKQDIAVAALLDAQPSVRENATAYLKAQSYDLSGFYRNVLQSSAVSAKRIQVALTELSKLRDLDDLDLIKSFIEAPRPSIRLAALTAWLKVSEGDKDSIALEALADVAPRVRQFALQTVRKQRAYIPYPAARKILEEKGDFALLLQFSASSKWASLECIARTSLQVALDDLLKPLLAEALRDWIRRAGSLYDVASPEQIEFLTSERTMSAFSNLLRHDDMLIRRLESELAQDASNKKFTR